MTTAAPKVLIRSLASIALILAAPGALAGQSPSSRPASVSLTVVVPAQAPPAGSLTADARTVVTARTPTAIDLETMVGLADRPASRIEVRLGSAWDTDSARVWLRNRNGTFEQLLRDAPIVAVDAPLALAAHVPLHFRIEPTRPPTFSSVAIPVEYRLTIGAGDRIAVWSYPALIRFDSARSNHAPNDTDGAVRP
jgi:hypothetical protein